MEFKKSVIIVLLICSPLLPIALEAQTTVSSGVPEAITEEEVRCFIDKYIDRYKAMNLELFMELYSSKSVENRMLPYADIRKRYQRVFAETNQLVYHVTLYSVKTYGQRAFVTGQYKTIQTLKEGNEMKTFRGNIQWNLIREEGALKVSEVAYGAGHGAY